MKKFIFLLTICTTLLAASCNKDDDTNPTNTEPHSTLRCKINDEDWTPAGGDLFTTQPYSLYYYSDTKILGLDATNTTLDAVFKGSISMAVDNVTIENNPIVDNESLWHIHNSRNSDECKWYNELENTFNNFVNIEVIDTIDYFIIGTFEFSAINECNDTIRVTDGYFDLKYKF